MKSFKSHFKFNKQERSGIFFLLLVIVVLQCAYFIFKIVAFGKPQNTFLIDSNVQIKIDGLKKGQPEKDSIKIYPFNPNFISDHKGYLLGMSTDEIDRLHAFRGKNKYVSSPNEFQEVTLVSDSLLNAISPYFKFPSWGKSQKIQKENVKTQPIAKLNAFNDSHQPKDLNKASGEDLKAIKGIGDILSARIIKFRDRLGGFLVDEQLYDVYGLEPEVVEKTLQKFRVLHRPNVRKININTASAKELAQLVYIKYNVAKKILDYRESVGTIVSLDELTKIEDFPSDKINRIKLYLTL